MVYMRVALHENDRNHENNENDKVSKIGQAATNEELSAGLAEFTETKEMTITTAIRVEKRGFPKQRV